MINTLLKHLEERHKVLTDKVIIHPKKNVLKITNKKIICQTLIEDKKKNMKETLNLKELYDNTKCEKSLTKY